MPLTTIEFSELQRDRKKAVGATWPVIIELGIQAVEKLNEKQSHNTPAQYEERENPK